MSFYVHITRRPDPLAILANPLTRRLGDPSPCPMVSSAF